MNSYKFWRRYCLDTQIISYAYKGDYAGQIKQQSIASVTAKEFLLVQGSERTRANYYVPLPRVIKFLVKAKPVSLSGTIHFPKGLPIRLFWNLGKITHLSLNSGIWPSLE